MNLRRRKIHSVSFHYWGWTANTLCFAVAGEAFVLTSPFIERDYRNVARRRLATHFTALNVQKVCNQLLNLHIYYRMGVSVGCGNLCSLARPQT